MDKLCLIRDVPECVGRPTRAELDGPFPLEVVAGCRLDKLPGIGSVNMKASLFISWLNRGRDLAAGIYD